jgi:BetI-type transcriptional repressor, C-terminal
VLLGDAVSGTWFRQPRQRAVYERIHGEPHGACISAGTARADAGLTAAGLDLPLEAQRLHALLDGLAPHAVLRPASLPLARVVAIVARHLDSLRRR